MSARELTGHKVNPANDVLQVLALDGPGPGGASHLYHIGGFNPRTNPSSPNREFAPTSLTVLFQNGPIAEAGVNGVTHEALIEILIDRLECFQKGPYASIYNADALLHLRGAQKRLLDRTRERMARQVEGTHQV